MNLINKNRLSALTSILLFALSYALVFKPEDLQAAWNIVLISRFSSFNNYNGSMIPSASVSLTSLSPGTTKQLNSGSYMVRCTSLLSACSSEYFMLSSQGELIHGAGRPNDDPTNIIWKSKAKGFGDYVLSYESSGYITIIKKGILPLLPVLDVDDSDERPESGEDPLYDAVEKLEKGVKTRTGGGNRVTNAVFKSLKFAGRKVGIVKDPTKNRRVLRKKAEKLPHLTPWPFSIV
ncbi:hypothetical protein TL16_g06578 [Triparma laevis f. inornata]|uniref:Uncharacterized protein n=2 Tax=Triparma laevis TaxID=1534972 RepID=A0A9W7KYS0_9STRA|nr:hypothetical protein TL16_g06578 [Triparma laevis f. inornata]GMI16832.1 hypothetical protein TrLO_g6220 [Triparma laevis f. longispina]